MRRRLSGEQKERHNLRKREATWIRSKSRSGGGDELRGQDAWDVRVSFVTRSDVESRQGSDHEKKRSIVCVRWQGAREETK